MSVKFKPFTLFLCLAAAAFIIFGWRLVTNRMVIEHGNRPIVEKQWEGVITIWDYPRPYPDGSSGFGWLRERISRFEKSHPGVFVELRGLSWEEGPIQLDVAANSGTHPDIAPVGTNLGYARKGLLEPLGQLSDPQFQARYLDYAVNAVSWEDIAWGIPLYGAAPVMLLNLELFEERGISPPEQGRWTYDEFVDTLKALTFDRDGDGVCDVFGFHSFILNGYTNLWGIVASDGWNIYDHELGRYTIDRPEAISGLKKLVDLVTEYRVVPEDFGISTADDAWKAFSVERRVAVYPEGLWAINHMERLRNEGKGFDYALAEYPIGDFAAPVTVSEGVAAYGLFRQHDDKKRDICIEFLEYISNSFDSDEIKRRNVIPVLKDNIMVRNRPALNPGQIKAVPRMEHWSYVEDIINKHIRQAVLGNESPEQAFRAAQLEVDQLYRKQ
jgi:multiple sugar transport system substrate-binding protein